MAGLDERRRELEEREQAFSAAAEEAAERERLLDERERQIAEREESLGTTQSELEQRERKLRRKHPRSEKTTEEESTDPEYMSTALTALERDLEKRAAAVEGVEDRIAEREAALAERETTLAERETKLAEIERTLTRLQADVDQEQQAAAETLRTIEAREQGLAEAEADIEKRKLALAELEREAEASKQAREDEAERVRIAASDLAARERALSEAQAELARRDGTASRCRQGSGPVSMRSPLPATSAVLGEGPADQEYLRLASAGAAAERPDLQAPLLADVLDLKRRVLEPELPGEHLLELEPPRVAVVPAGDEDVCGQGWETGRDRPDVQVVHLDDAFGRGHAPADLACVDPGRSRFEQDHDRVAEDAPRARQDEERDRHPRDRIRLLPASREDDDRGDRDPDGRSQIGEDVPERGLHVQAFAGRPHEDRGRDHVDGETRPARRASIQPPRISGGSSRRPIASMKIQIAIATSTRPLTSAARISAR